MNLTLTQMRHSARNLIAVALAIILGIAFVTTTLLVGTVVERSAWNAVAAQYNGVDAVITSNERTIHLTEKTVRDVQAVGGVVTAEGRQALGVRVTANPRSTYAVVAALPDAAPIRDNLHLADGRFPQASGEIMLLAPMATELNARTGDTITIAAYTGGQNESTRTVKVVGILKGADSFGGTGAPDMYAWPSDLRSWAPQIEFNTILVTAKPGTSPNSLISGLTSSLDKNLDVRTRDQQAAHMTSGITGGTSILTISLLAFALIALFVASIVIGNTFTILVAQRTRNLALLRCVGATRAQIRRSVLFEAAILGGITSCIGIALGIGMIVGAVQLYAANNPESIIASPLPVPLSTLLVPFLLGVFATIVSAWGPAKAATNVAPLAALRPAPLEAIRSHASLRRTILALMLLGGGGLVMLGGVVLSLASPNVGSMLLGVFGGMLSFLGILVGAVLIVPRVVSLMGAIVARFGGAPARIAFANSARNPKRTTATATALLIAVTLVTMMSVGAESTKSTLGRVIDEREPIDIVISTDAVAPKGNSGPDIHPALPSVVDQTLASNPAIAETGLVLESSAMLDGTSTTILGVDPDAARHLSHAPGQLDGLADGTAVIPTGLANERGIADGDTIQFTNGDRHLSVTAKVTKLWDTFIILTGGDLLSIDPDAAANQLWARIKDDADASAVVGTVQDSFGNVTGIQVAGGANQKAQTTKILDTLLLVVTGLLGVAVVIALVGVGNTLSLSVIERTRESAILRAMGLTRSQLRWMLAIEGILIALVGAALGIVLGIIYGFAGTLTLLGNTWGISLSVPTGRLLLVVAIAIIAGVLASVLPARSAVKTSPVAALAE